MLPRLALLVLLCLGVAAGTIDVRVVPGAGTVEWVDEAPEGMAEWVETPEIRAIAQGTLRSQPPRPAPIRLAQPADAPQHPPPEA